MKRALFTAAMLAASVSLTAGAESDVSSSVSSSNVFGVLPVNNTAKRIIVAVPWVSTSATGSDITASNIIHTANLSVGDLLHYVPADEGGSYHTWRLAVDDGGVKYWESVNQAKETDKDVSPSANGYGVNRGSAFVLIRTNPSESTPFYLNGQVGATPTVATTIVAGAPESPSYTLIASPKPTEWNPNADATWTNVGANDALYVSQDNGTVAGLTLKLVWNDSQWCELVDNYVTIGGKTVRKGQKKVPYEASITAGKGIWYVSFGGAPTVTWKNIPVPDAISDKN